MDFVFNESSTNSSFNSDNINGNIQLSVFDRASGSHQTICSVPHWLNCSESFAKKTRELFEDLWAKATLVIYILYAVTLIGNVTILMVLTQKKYKTKIVPNTLVFIYVGNMIYMAVMTFFNGGLPFTDNASFDENMYCKATFIVAAFLRATTNWILVFVALIHASTIYFPDKCVGFRANPHYSWLVMTIAIVISLSTTWGILSDKVFVQVCGYLTKKLCLFFIPNSYFLLNFVFPLVLILLCSVTIAYSSCHMDRFLSSSEAQSSSRVNRLIIGSTVLFALTTLPLMIYFFMMELDTDIPGCTYYFYKRALKHVVVMTLSMLNFGLDCFVFLVISPPFRHDVIEIYRNNYRHIFQSKERKRCLHSGTESSTIVRGTKTEIIYPRMDAAPDNEEGE